MTRVEVKEQTLDGDRGIVDLLAGDIAQLVAHFTAVAVNAVAYAVEHTVALAVDGGYGKILYVIVDAYGRISFLKAEIVPEVVSASGGVIVDVVAERKPVGVVDEPVERSVASCDDDTVILGKRCEKGFIAFNGGHVAEDKFIVFHDVFQLHGILGAVSVSGVRVIEYVVSWHGSILSFL